MMTQATSSFTKAIVRPPGRTFSSGLTTVDLGHPNHELALEQHRTYCQALQDCGLELISLGPDDRYPDSTFVEDTAILIKGCAIVTRPGAETRKGEVAAIKQVLDNFFSRIECILEPGTLDGGDVCEVGNHFFIGISQRTNEAGAKQLAELLALFDYTSSFIDVRDVAGILHLKSGLSCIGDKRLVVIDALGGEDFRNYDRIRVTHGEEYAANCVRVNDTVLVAAGFPKLAEQLQAIGYKTILLDMSEFQKMDGGLSCLSLRF